MPKITRDDGGVGIHKIENPKGTEHFIIDTNSNPPDPYDRITYETGGAIIEYGPVKNNYNFLKGNHKIKKVEVGKNFLDDVSIETNSPGCTWYFFYGVWYRI